MALRFAKEKPNFKEMDLPELKRVYEEMAEVLAELDVRVRPAQFKDRSEAVARCEALHSQIRARDAGLRDEAKRPSTSPGLARLRANPEAENIRRSVVAEQEAELKAQADRSNTMTEAQTQTQEKPVTKAKKPAAAKKTAAKKTAAKKTAAPAKAKAKKPAATKKTAAPAKANGAARGRAAAFGDTDKIKLLVKDNPKRAKAAERFEFYRDCATVGDYVARCEKEGYTRGNALADMRWDAKKGWIKVG